MQVAVLTEANFSCGPKTSPRSLDALQNAAVGRSSSGDTTIHATISPAYFTGSIPGVEHVTAALTIGRGGRLIL